MMIKKLTIIIETSLLISLLLLTPCILLFMLINGNQLTSASFKKIDFLNSEILKLKPISGLKFTDKDEIIFNIDHFIDPSVFEKYYFLDDYLIREKTAYVYYFKNNKLKDLNIKESELSDLKNKLFYNQDSLRSYLYNLIKTDKNFFISDYSESHLEEIYFVPDVEELYLKDEIKNKLHTLKDQRFKSAQAFEQALRETIGLENYKIYKEFIESTKDNKATWQKLILKIDEYPRLATKAEVKTNIYLNQFHS